MNQDGERTISELQDRIAALEQQVENLSARPGFPVRCIRRRSEVTILGMPLYDIATGPDPQRGELRGHARGFIAIGDIATGVFALGGISRGVFAIGGVAVGGFTLGGVSLGVMLGCGGVATGLFALGGVAIGGVAVGGMAIGKYACGGGAVGQFVINATRRDPEAVQFFTQWFPWVRLPR